MPPRTAAVVIAAETVEWVRVRNEVDALMLENELIKRHQPRCNVRMTYSDVLLAPSPLVRAAVVAGPAGLDLGVA